MRAYAQLTGSFVVFCNRVGIDESLSFWGGSEIIGPTGAAVLSAPLYDEGLFLADIRPADIRRERIAMPLRLDERPELQVREMSRIVAERAWMAYDTTADLHRLTTWAIEHGLELAALTVMPPTLEDIYLELTEEAS